MSEEGKDDVAPVEQHSQEMLGRLRNAEFGSVPYQAASDFCRLQKLYNTLGTDVYCSAVVDSSQPTDAEGWKQKIVRKSLARITETRVALLEHEIDQKADQIEGYSNEYRDLISVSDGLLAKAGKEAHDKFLEEMGVTIVGIQTSTTFSE